MKVSEKRIFNSVSESFTLRGNVSFLPLWVSLWNGGRHSSEAELYLWECIDILAPLLSNV